MSLRAAPTRLLGTVQALRAPCLTCHHLVPVICILTDIKDIRGQGLKLSVGSRSSETQKEVVAIRLAGGLPKTKPSAQQNLPRAESLQRWTVLVEKPQIITVAVHSRQKWREKNEQTHIF